MGENTEISWATHTFNPWRGCAKVSPGCKHCYAERMSKRNPSALGTWGKDGVRVMASESYWRKPLKWGREAVRPIAPPERPRVFCASLADVFEDWNGPIVNARGETMHRGDAWYSDRAFVPGDRVGMSIATLSDVRRRLFDLIDATPNLIWLILSKRPENVRRLWPNRVLVPNADGQGHGDITDFRDNVWLGTSVEDQERADERIPQLLACRDLCAGLFLSCEPLLGAVDLTNVDDDEVWLDCLSGVYSRDRRNAPGRKPDGHAHDEKIDWVIAGTESGPSRRVADVVWMERLRDQCFSAGVPFFVKQLEIEGKVCHDVNRFPEGLRFQQVPFGPAISGSDRMGVGQVWS